MMNKSVDENIIAMVISSILGWTTSIQVPLKLILKKKNIYHMRDMQ